ncbi:RHS repeat-associated core domain-containing protein, partial [Hahella sp. CR1]|uniref:RHS repeat domain-containing protein n=1 Tax=Hahella sp. CR1 TaxID=2992807 RepID=UPI0024434688
NILSGESDSAVKKGNRLQFHGDRHFEYDDAGNLIRERRGKGGKLETRYVYNKQNQLIAVEKDGQRTEYRYDALGRRISKQDAFGQTEFLWNGDVLLSEQRQHLRKLYVYEPDSFRPLAFIQDEKVYHYHLDHLGTPQEMTDAEGTLVWSARYKAYGALALQDVESVHNPLRFQGQYYDEETGFHYNRHRYYDPQSGRFINQDPIGLLGGANAYQYAPNPVGWVDPFGLTCKEKTGFFASIRNFFSRNKRQDPALEKELNVDPQEKVLGGGDKAVPLAIINGQSFEPTMMHGQGFHGMRIPNGMTIEDLFEKGLPRKGDNYDLVNHAKGGQDTAFRGTSPFIISPDKTYGGPLEWADDGGILVEIDGAPMFNVNELLDGRVQGPNGEYGGNPFPAEAENAVFAEVKPEHIKRIAVVEKGERGLQKGDWIDNPNFSGNKTDE